MHVTAQHNENGGNDIILYYLIVLGIRVLMSGQQ